MGSSELLVMCKSGGANPTTAFVSVLDGTVRVFGKMLLRNLFSGDAHLSREHFKIEFLNGRVFVTNLSTSNPTFIRTPDGNKIVLKEGTGDCTEAHIKSIIVAGQSSFRLEEILPNPLLVARPVMPVASVAVAPVAVAPVPAPPIIVAPPIAPVPLPTPATLPTLTPTPPPIQPPAVHVPPISATWHPNGPIWSPNSQNPANGGSHLQNVKQQGGGLEFPPDGSSYAESDSWSSDDLSGVSSDDPSAMDRVPDQGQDLPLDRDSHGESRFTINRGTHAPNPVGPQPVAKSLASSEEFDDGDFGSGFSRISSKPASSSNSNEDASFDSDSGSQVDYAEGTQPLEPIKKDALNDEPRQETSSPGFDSGDFTDRFADLDDDR